MYLNGFPDGSDALGDRFDRMLGLHYVMTRWHGGQWSTGYRLLCRTEISNAPANLDNRDEYYSARHYAARYLCAVRARLKRRAW